MTDAASHGLCTRSNSIQSGGLASLKNINPKIKTSQANYHTKKRKIRIHKKAEGKHSASSKLLV
jgi:hypothetical protein